MGTAGKRDFMPVPRLEDLPYHTSPPIQFVYESTANLVLGSYTWADNPTLMVPTRPIINNAMYFFRSITLSADISELDFTAAITTTPEFNIQRESDAQAVLFREAIRMNKFYDQFDYRLVWEAKSQEDRLYATFNGILFQIASLVGKLSITLKAIISAQEIINKSFIENFKAEYPEVPNSVRREGVNNV